MTGASVLIGAGLFASADTGTTLCTAGGFHLCALGDVDEITLSVLSAADAGAAAGGAGCSHLAAGDGDDGAKFSLAAADAGATAVAVGIDCAARNSDRVTLTAAAAADARAACCTAGGGHASPFTGDGDAAPQTGSIPACRAIAAADARAAA